MIKPTFTIKTQKKDREHGVFVIEPLPQGFGHTIGNSLRRVLLSFIPGAAISSVKIKGVKHQFSMLKGMREDVVDLVLNLKKVQFSLEGEDTAKITLTKVGPGEVKASDMTLPASVTIANPDEYLASLADKTTKLDAEIIVERGIGYSQADSRKSTEIGLIPVDSLFSPIRRVNFSVEETRVGRETNFDKLILEIITNGTIDAEDSMKTAAKIMTSYMSYMYTPTEAIKPPESSTQVSETILQTPVEEFELSVRVTNALKKGGFKTLRDFVGSSRSDLERVRNLGEKSISLIIDQLKEKGIGIES